MAKSNKHVTKIGSFEDFRAPWETESGDETEVNKPTLKRLIYNLKVGEAKAKDEVVDAQADLETVTTERDDFKARAESGDGAEAAKQIEKLTKQVNDLTAERDTLVSANEERELREKVLVGLPEKYAKRVTGKTEDELKASLKELAEDFDIPLDKDGLYDPKAAEGDGDDEDFTGRTAPVLQTRVVRNPSDPDDKGGDEVIDFDKIADQILAGQRGPL